MVIYSQILMWGQSACCILALCIVNFFGAGVPTLFAAMVPLGILIIILVVLVLVTGSAIDDVFVC